MCACVTGSYNYTVIYAPAEHCSEFALMPAYIIYLLRILFFFKGAYGRMYICAHVPMSIHMSECISVSANGFLEAPGSSAVWESLKHDEVMVSVSH